MDCKNLLCSTRDCALTFSLFEEPLCGRQTYSVAVYDGNLGHAYASDVTDDRTPAEKFLYLISEGGPEPCHLYDVLEDVLPLN